MTAPANPIDCPTRTRVHPLNRDRWAAFTAAPGQYRCSYCKSLRPDDAFIRLERGDPVTPEARADRMQLAGQFVYFAHFTDTHKQRLVDLYNAGQLKFSAGNHPFFFVAPAFMTFTPEHPKS